LSHFEKVLDFRKHKRADERVKKAKEANDKSYEEYNWDELCEQECKLKELRVLELNNYATEEYQTSDCDDVDDDVADNDDNDVDKDVDEEENTNDNVDSDTMHEDVVLSDFGHDEVEDLVRPTITRSGRSITRSLR
ncbi:Hypothetical predicted protein, partial [Paramuricea clavata]